MTAPALEVRGASKRYGAVQALRDVDLTVAAGEVVAVVGENGAGKSTLMGVVAGAVAPDAGTIAIAGVEQRFRSPLDAQRAGVRLVPQELVLVPELSAAENVSLAAMPLTRLRRLDRAAMRAEARRRLELLGVGELDVDRPVARLTVVEQAFVQVARALVPGGRVLIVDEATAPMSADEAEQLFAVIGRVAASGMAVLYISHRLDEVARVAGRIVVMRDAARVAEFTAATLSNEALVGAMIGDQDLSVGARRGSSGGAPRLTVEGLRTPLLGPIDLTVRAGEIVSVYGIAGAGREELGPAIVGAAPRSAGRVALDGAAIPPGRIRAAIEAGIGYVPAERRTAGLVLDRSIVDNVALSVLDRESRGGLLRRGRLRAVAAEYVARLDVATSSVDAPVRSLSGGGQQKVLLARCLAARSRALVLDEPTRGVDVAAKAEIYRTLRELAADGVAILVISSDIEEVATIGDRTIVLARGEMVAELAGRQITQEAITAAALSRALEAA